MYRVISKDTKEFLRDDFTFDPNTEIALNVEPSQGLIKPKWNDKLEVWEESANDL